MESGPPHGHSGSPPGSPFDRALFASFLIAEVHPFNDGNGRMSRLFMNARLLSGGGAHSLVPTSLHMDYLLALRALSSRNSAEPMRQVMLRRQEILNSLPLAARTLESQNHKM